MVDDAALNKLFKKHLKKGEKGPGVALGVIENGRILVSHCWGLAHIKLKTHVTATSVFDLASVSKFSTAIAVLQLMERGLIDLSCPISEYITEFKQPFRKRPITTAHLLHHTSGLPIYTSEWEDGFERYSVDDLVGWLNEQEPNVKPGTEHEYNNTGYGLLACIVQRVSGMKYSSYMKANVFGRLGMDHTYVVDT